ncbi:hydroxysqualene dehydroxylase HpnE [Shumkonia mesophila]|uniref:hydroxysqualene dehydroxylase HpnE n=1 Tax=Shumkonia mesophila TaxID=2838854 RepID=UPI00293487AA|nr:hydroxysqualene dehydroxylase HpnE [Shumkonia mesophila]
MAPRTFVIGAGMAGLSCAVGLSSLGREVEVLESAPHAGGRCRSYFDDHLGRRIDNGNHLLLSGNSATLSYLSEVGADDTLAGPDRAEFAFYDLERRAGWTIRPNAGRLPWWILAPSRRVPGTSAWDYFRAARLAGAGPSETVAQVLDDGGPLYRRFWHPFALAVMNTDPKEASAALLWPVVRETLGRGETAYRPRIARVGLSESLVDPALACLRTRGVEVGFGRRVRRLERTGDRVTAIDLGERQIAVGEEDSVVLAVPAAVCASLLPDLVVPTEYRAILNVHFRHADTPPGLPSMVGLVGGVAQWLFCRQDMVSVTVSAADAVEGPPEKIASRIWAEISQVLGCGGTKMPPFRVVKEKRATFAQTPEQTRRRPPARTSWRNLVLAGDWTDTGLPATIEGAVRSGRKAAEAVSHLSDGP